MKYFGLIAAALLGGIIGGSIAQTFAANQTGILPTGTWTQGGCVAIGAPAPNGNTFVLAPVACPAPPALAIGVTVAGSTANGALSVDANNKLTQINSLTAN